MKLITKGHLGQRQIHASKTLFFIRQISFIFVFCFALNTWAQTPEDAILMNAGEACVLINYSHGEFDQYWEGEKLRRNETIATVNRNTVLPMAAIGIIPHLNVYVSTPFVKTHSSEPSGGHLMGASGFQDIGFAAKYEFIRKQGEKGNFALLGSVGFSTPMTNYLSDYMPYSLGFGAPELSYRGIVQYETASGPYVRFSGAYLWRGYTKAERDSYYNNGSYYTPWMDVPSAYTLNGTVGAWLLNKSLLFEISLRRLQSLSGDDIRAYNAPQATNKVENTNVGGFVQYYPTFSKGLGILVGYNSVLAGRNTGKMGTTNVGLTYQFTYLKRKK